MNGMLSWYYAVDREQHGPVDREQLVELARAGTLKPDDLIWSPELGDKWVAAATQEWLSFRAAPPAVPRPAAPPPTAAAFKPPPGGGYGTTANRDLAAMARAALNGRWGLAVGASLVYMLILVAVSQIPCVPIFIQGPMSLGLAIFFLAYIRPGGAPSIGMLFDGFKQFGIAIGAQLLVGIFTLLWTLLLIVPGIIAAYSYAMTFFILADNPGMHSLEAIGRSKVMMQGHKWKLFCLQCRFIGWGLLCILTAGIGFIWLMPYMQAATAQFYDDLPRQ